MEIVDPLLNAADPTTKLVLQYLAGAGLLLLASALCWFDKIDKSIMPTLILAAAAAIGFSV